MHTPDGRRDFLKRLAAVAGGSWLIPPLTRAGLTSVADPAGAASLAVAPRRADAFARLPLRDVRLDGRLGRAIDLCVRNRVMAQDGEHLVEPFRQRRETNCWSSEFWGKWFLSAVAAQRYTGDPKLLETVERSARSMMATQSSDGYIGTYAPENRLKTWDVWGRKYTLLGLLAYHDLTGDRAALASARRLADHHMTEVGPGRASIVKNGAYRGMASSSILEPIVLLYNRTGDARYLAFAEWIVAQWETPDGPRLISKALAGVPVAERFPPPASWYAWENGQKAYEMMSCYEGLLELYRVTGTPEYLSAVVKTWENIRDTEINVAGSGASMECWYGGAAKQTVQARHMMETCVTMTWMKLSQNLLRLTGDPRIADEIERSAYNALLGSMVPDVRTGEYARIERTWRAGDEVRIELDVGARVVRAPGARDRYVAVVRGPVVLARDSRLNAGAGQVPSASSGQAVDEVASLRTDARGRVELQRASSTPDSVWMAFGAPFERGLHDATGELRFTDYSSAGNAWTEADRFRVWLPQLLDPSRSGGA
jgi:DUF1680 family protein